MNPATVLLLGGVICSLLLVVFATWAPVSPGRWAIAARTGVHHREDLVVAGIALFLITVSVWLIAR